MANFCSHCGRPLTAEINFCPNCGTKVALNHDREKVKPPTKPPDNSDKELAIAGAAGLAGVALASQNQTASAQAELTTSIEIPDNIDEFFNFDADELENLTSAMGDVTDVISSVTEELGIEDAAEFAVDAVSDVVGDVVGDFASEAIGGIFGSFF